MDTPANQDVQFEGSKRIRVARGDVFDFISRIENLPAYLAMVTEAHDLGEDRIRMTVNLHGEEHTDDGRFHRDPLRHRIEWGNERGDYTGWMTVEDEDGDARLTVHLRWGAESPFPEVIDQESAKDHPVDDAIEATLESVKNILEGTGGAVHPDEANA